MSKHITITRAGMWFYRARCRCGWRSRRRWNRINAEADGEQHERAANLPFYHPEET